MRTYGEVSSTTSERRAGARRRPKAVSACATLGIAQSNLTAPATQDKLSERAVSFFDLLVALQKIPSLLEISILVYSYFLGILLLFEEERQRKIFFVPYHLLLWG